MSEAFVLGRRGLALGPASRRPARSPWFASFAFPRPRVASGAPGEPMPQETVSFDEDAFSLPEEAETGEQAQENRDGPHFPARSAKAKANRGQTPISRNRGLTPISPKDHDRIRGQSPNSSQRTQEQVRALTPNSTTNSDRALTTVAVKELSAVEAVRDHEVAAGDVAASSALRNSEEGEPGARDSGSAASLARSVRHPAATQEASTSTQEIAAPAPGLATLRNAAHHPGALSLAQSTRRAKASFSPGKTPGEPRAPIVMPMGKPPGVPAPAQEPPIAQRRMELQRLMTRSVAAPSVTRIGTVEIVVKAPPDPAPRPSAPAPAPAAPQPVRHERKAMPFRNPWTASRWRRGE